MNFVSSLYIHFPFCRHLCNYCDFFKSIPKNSDDITKFHHYLEKNVENLLELAERENYKILPLKTLYIGGGTPSLWGEKGALFLGELLKKNGLILDKNVEATLEVNPGSWTEESLIAFQDIGMNRFSLGIQSYDERYLKILDRVHSLNDVVDTLTYFNKHNLNFSTDFMLGLPNSVELDRNIIRELDQILEFNPNHLSLYILTIKSNYVHRKSMPMDDFVAEEYLNVANYLKNKGYDHYEVSNFAKPNKESIHNIAYWKSEPVLALGPSATGFFPTSKLRFKGKPKTPDFDEEILEEDSFKLESLYMRLRINEFFDLRSQVKENSWKSLVPVVEKWVAETMLEKDALGNVRLTSKGFLQLDTFMDELFRHNAI